MIESVEASELEVTDELSLPLEVVSEVVAVILSVSLDSVTLDSLVPVD